MTLGGVKKKSPLFQSKFFSELVKSMSNVDENKNKTFNALIY